MVLDEVELNQDNEYVQNNIINGVSDEHAELNDDTRMPGYALFVSPEDVYEDIREVVFDNKRPEMPKEPKKKRFQRIRGLFSSIKNIFRSNEKQLEQNPAA